MDVHRHAPDASWPNPSGAAMPRRFNGNRWAAPCVNQWRRGRMKTCVRAGTSPPWSGADRSRAVRHRHAVPIGHEVLFVDRKQVHVRARRRRCSGAAGGPVRQAGDIDLWIDCDPVTLPVGTRAVAVQACRHRMAKLPPDCLPGPDGTLEWPWKNLSPAERAPTDVRNETTAPNPRRDRGVAG